MKRVFADDWRDTLREQYKYVIQQGDKRTEATLIEVLHEVGFTENELAALRLEATMRAEDMPDDFVPDEVKGMVAGVDVPAEAAEADISDAIEEVEPEVVIADEADDSGESDKDEEETDAEAATYDELVEMADTPAPGEVVDEEINDAAPEDDDDEPQQMSLF